MTNTKELTGYKKIISIILLVLFYFVLVYDRLILAFLPWVESPKIAKVVKHRHLIERTIYRVIVVTLCIIIYNVLKWLITG